MKSLAVIFVMMLAVAIALPAHPSARVRMRCGDDRDGLFRGKNVSVDIEDGSILFTDEDSDETVEITEQYDLIVNGRRVRLDREEQKLVEDYYESFHYVIAEALAIAAEGAKIGVKGAGLGLKACLGTFKLLSPDYDSDDLERSLEREGRKLERLGTKLEKRGKRLERKAERLQDLHDELRREIDELGDLGWF